MLLSDPREYVHPNDVTKDRTDSDFYSWFLKKLKKRWHDKSDIGMMSDVDKIFLSGMVSVHPFVLYTLTSSSDPAIPY